MRYLLALLLFTSSVEAQIYAEILPTGQTVIFKNKCPDLPPEAFIPATNLAEWEALTITWACFNLHQSAQSSEILRQIKLALKNTRFNKKITIYSVDPYCTKDYCEYDAKVVKGKVYFSGDPGGCPNVRRKLERLLRKLK